MDRFADMLGGSGTWLSRLSMADGSGIGIVSRIDPERTAPYDAYYGRINPYSNAADPQAFMAGWAPTIVTDEDLVPRAQLARNEYFHDFMKPQDIQSFMIVRLEAHGLEISSLTINRPSRRDPFGPSELARARRFHGHFRRAFRLSERLATSGLIDNDLEVQRTGAGDAIFLLDDEGRLKRTNAAADALLARRDDLRAVGGHLTTPDDPSGRLTALVAAAGARAAGERTGGSMSLHASESRPPLNVTVAPMRSDRLAIFRQRPAVIVCVSEPGVGTDARLTVRERDALSWVAQGKSDWEIAAILGLSETTVRFHVDNARKKLGAVNRAQAVARLMAGNG